MRRALVVVLTLGCLVSGCPKDRTTGRGTVPDPICGDDRIDTGEECDSSQLIDQTCQSLGFDMGTLKCSDTCTLDKSDCSNRCGNGVLDPGEACDGTLGVEPCAEWGYRACTSTCTLDATHCVQSAVTATPAAQLSESAPAIIAELAPSKLGDLVIPIPGLSQLQTYRYTNEQGFIADRKISTLNNPYSVVAANLDGDASGNVDLAAIQTGGTVERLLYTPGSTGTGTYPAEPYMSSSAVAALWVGAGKLDSDAADDAVAFANPGLSMPIRFGGFLVFRGGSVAAAPELHTEAGVISATIADFDRDGLDDVLFVSDAVQQLQILKAPMMSALTPIDLPFAITQLSARDLDGDGDVDLLVDHPAAGTVEVLENTGSAFVSRASFTAAGPRGLSVGDFDLDGRVDLAWLSGTTLQIRRSAGGFMYTTYEASASTGTPLTLSVGDLEGDGDLDFAATYAAGGSATITYGFVNRVR